MDADKIHAAAVRAHGAKRVYDAAHSRMSGARMPLEKIGLVAHTIANAVQIASVAYDNLGPAAQAIDLAQTQSKLSQLDK